MTVRTRRVASVELGWRGRLAVGAGVLVVLQLAFRGGETFPTAFDTWLSRPFDALYDWVLENQFTHPVFTGFFSPISDAVAWMLDGLTNQLLTLPWYGLAVIVFALVAARTARWRMALAGAAAAVAPGLVGLWVATMETLSMMVVSVAISVVLGVPLGIAAALNRRFEQGLRPVLDAMQTIPAPTYLVLTVMVFTTGPVPGAVATVIYALPPVVRLTTLGIHGVPRETVEAATMFGSTRRQVLLKVQLPQAVPAVATGVNQTINMGLGIIVIAALVGAGGLGQEAFEMLRQRRTGRGLVAGLCVMCVAVVLDRVSRSFVERPDRSRGAQRRRRRWLVAGGVGLALVVLGRVLQWTAFPHDFGVDWAGFVDDVLVWVRDTFHDQLGWLSDTFTREVYVRLRDWMTVTVAWPVWVALAAMVGAAAGGRRLGLFAAAAVFVIGATGLWVPSGETFVQVAISAVLATLIAVPVGVWSGHRPRVAAALSPLLDMLQTIPAVTYVLPFVLLFDVGVVPGIIASVMYAVAPGVRVTALGVAHVPGETIEAATTFGASERQLLWGVRVPLALPAIMLAVNQVILTTVAMVIITGMSGGGALGYRMIEAFTRQLIGQGVEVALCLALMAMVLDRLTQALAERAQPPPASH